MRNWQSSRAQSPTGELAGDGGKDRISALLTTWPSRLYVRAFFWFDLTEKSKSALTDLIVQKAPQLPAA